MSDHVDKAVTITKEGKDGVLKIDQDALERILIETAPQDIPIAIISVAGSMRTGKSFILNFFIRYLRRQGWKNSGWIGDDETAADDGMKWRGGCKRDTTGIIIWNEVFIVPNDRGEKIAVFIMDTQGLWDNKTTKDNNIKLFTFSTIISSVQVLNVMRQVEERELENLQLCVEYATAAAKEREPQFTLQKLLFLVRDWSCEDDFVFGVAGGNMYIEQVLESGRNLQELSEVSTHLRSSFSKLECFLMPTPGSKVAASAKAFTGKNKDIETNFMSALQDLVKLLLHPSNLLPKALNDTDVKPRELMNVVFACDEVFGKKGLPPVQTMLEAMAKAHNKSALQSALKQYIDGMKEIISGKAHISNELLEDAHRNNLQQAKNCYDQAIKIGSDKIRDDYRQNLMKECQDTFGLFKERNGMKKKNYELRLQKSIGEYLAKYKEQMSELQTLKRSPLEDSQFCQSHQNYSSKALKAFRNSTKGTHSEQFFLQCEKELKEGMQTFFDKERVHNQGRLDTEKAQRRKLDGNSVPDKELERIHGIAVLEATSENKGELMLIECLDHDNELTTWKAEFNENYGRSFRENQKKRLEEQELREKERKRDLEHQKQKEANELREQELREKERKMDLEHQKQKEANELREQELREQDALVLKEKKQEVMNDYRCRIEKGFSGEAVSVAEIAEMKDSWSEESVSTFKRRTKENLAFSEKHAGDLKKELLMIFEKENETYDKAKKKAKEEFDKNFYRKEPWPLTEEQRKKHEDYTVEHLKAGLFMGSAAALCVGTAVLAPVAAPGAAIGAVIYGTCATISWGKAVWNDLNS